MHIAKDIAAFLALILALTTAWVWLEAEIPNTPAQNIEQYP